MFSMVLLLFLISLMKADEDFIINNPMCKMPNYAPFTEEVNNIYNSLPYVNCTSLDLLTYTTVENNTAFLRFNYECMNQYYSSRDNIDCCYSYVERNGSKIEPDVGISVSFCKSFNSTVLLERDTVIVKCYLGADKIYENVHATITVTDTVKKKMKKLSENSDMLRKKPLSVLLIVIDSVARLNFERTMPLTKKFLTDNDFTEFLGYNKIDDNTFPNFNALLTGLNLKQSTQICKPKKIGRLDKCPMIWYDYRNAGYATAYAEDWADISTFNYLKKGFENPPTDYYFKPYMEASQTLNTFKVDSMPFCAGPESQGERILNLSKDFALTFKTQPSFGIFWMNTFSHNHINSPSRMDITFRNFFEGLKKEKILNESMVVLLADHGMRFGNIRLTIQGWYEERLPMNFISLPPWFKERYSRQYENFMANARRLTSTYDLYMTLQDVLSLSVENYTVTDSRACPSCRSLFSEIPERRSCDSAGIPEVWCTCIGKFEKIPTETPDFNKAVLKFILDSNVLNSSSRSISKIISSSITHHHRKMYILIIFETDEHFVFQVLIKANRIPFTFIKILQIRRL